MPRSSRKNINSEYIHLITQGIRKEYIFQKEEYKKKYLKIINYTLKEYNEVKVLAYCIMDNHAHLLVNVKDIDCLSGAMRKINTLYAMYYNKKENRVGYVFRNRYYTQQILNRKQLYNTIAYIHKNPVKAGMVEEMKDYINSSYCDFKFRKINIEIPELIFGTKQYMEIFNQVHRDFIDEDIYDVQEEKEREEEINNERLEKLIIKFCEENNTQLEIIRKNNKLILELVNSVKSKLNVKEKKLHK